MTSSSGNVTMLLSDHLGSTSVAVVSSGQAVSQRYWAWGEARPSGSLPICFQYIGL